MFLTGKGTKGLRDHRDKRFLVYSEAKHDQFLGGPVQVASYGIQDKHHGLLDIKLMINEIQNGDLDRGLDVLFNNEKINLREGYHPDMQRSYKCRGDVKKSLASYPIPYLHKDT